VSADSKRTSQLHSFSRNTNVIALDTWAEIVYTHAPALEQTFVQPAIWPWPSLADRGRSAHGGSLDERRVVQRME
jgi:hypothetical protein